VEPALILDVARDALWMSLKLGMPVLLVALVVGLVVSLLQALTQIQEMTLSFVPKMIAVFLTLWLCMPLMARWLGQMTQRLFACMAML
jgi:flagellar biosynthetic protein FliQ